MATIGTIAVNLTADARPLQGGLSVAKRSIDDFDRTTSHLRGNTMNASMAFLELSRGIEDAKVGFDTNGLQGAVRGSLNNIAQMAMFLGGPMTAAITTFVAVGLSTLVTEWMKSADSTKEAKEALDSYHESLKRSIDLSREWNRTQQEIGQLKTSDNAKSMIESFQRDLSLNRLEQNQLMQQQQGLRKRGGQFLADGDTKSWEETNKQFLEIGEQRHALATRELHLQLEIEQARKRQLALAAKEKQEAEDSKAIAQFQAKLRKESADAQKGQSILEGGMQAISPGLFDEFQRSMQIRELQGMNLPPEIQDALAGVIGGAFAARPQSTELPSFVRSGSQQAAQLDFQDSQKAKEREQAREAIETLKEIHNTLEDIKQQNVPIQSDSINLD